jgi:hypothetical protein
MQEKAPTIGPGKAIPIVTIFTALALFLFSQAVIAHDSWISRHQFYDPNSGAWCCDEHDCAALDEIEVRETGNGFIVADKYFVSRQRVLPSSDGNYWACFNSEGKGAHDRKEGVRCFFAPMSS